jgi:predicted small secreted protein
MKMKRNWIILMLMFSLFGLTACNTIAGAGKDIEKGGEAISDTAKDAKN